MRCTGGGSWEWGAVVGGVLVDGTAGVVVVVAPGGAAPPTVVVVPVVVVVSVVVAAVVVVPPPGGTSVSSTSQPAWRIDAPAGQFRPGKVPSELANGGMMSPQPGLGKTGPVWLPWPCWMIESASVVI